MAEESRQKETKRFRDSIKLAILFASDEQLLDILVNSLKRDEHLLCGQQSRAAYNSLWCLALVCHRESDALKFLAMDLCKPCTCKPYRRRLKKIRLADQYYFGNPATVRWFGRLRLTEEGMIGLLLRQEYILSAVIHDQVICFACCMRQKQLPRLPTMVLKKVRQWLPENCFED